MEGDPSHPTYNLLLKMILYGSSCLHIQYSKKAKSHRSLSNSKRPVWGENWWILLIENLYYHQRLHGSRCTVMHYAFKKAKLMDTIDLRFIMLDIKDASCCLDIKYVTKNKTACIPLTNIKCPVRGEIGEYRWSKIYY